MNPLKVERENGIERTRRLRKSELYFDGFKRFSILIRYEHFLCRPEANKGLSRIDIVRGVIKWFYMNFIVVLFYAALWRSVTIFKCKGDGCGFDLFRGANDFNFQIIQIDEVDRWVFITKINNLYFIAELFIMRSNCNGWWILFN